MQTLPSAALIGVDHLEPHHVETRDWPLSSSSHALIGGLVGAALVQSAGTNGVQWHGLAHKVILPALVAPAIAFAAAFALLLAIYWAFRSIRPSVANRGFRLGQARHRHVGRIRPRLERCPENDGSDRACARAPRPRKRRCADRAELGEDRGRGRDRRRHLRRRLADHAYPWPWHFQARARERLCRPQAASGEYYAATKYGYPLSTTHVVSGAISPAPAPPRACPPFAGASPVASPSRGSLRYRRPLRLLPCCTGRSTRSRDSRAFHLKPRGAGRHVPNLRRTFDAVPAELASARAAIDAFCEQEGVRPRLIDDIRLAVAKRAPTASSTAATRTSTESSRWMRGA